MVDEESRARDLELEQQRVSNRFMDSLLTPGMAIAGPRNENYLRLAWLNTVPQVDTRPLEFGRYQEESPSYSEQILSVEDELNRAFTTFSTNRARGGALFLRSGSFPALDLHGASSCSSLGDQDPDTNKDLQAEVINDGAEYPSDLPLSSQIKANQGNTRTSNCISKCISSTGTRSVFERMEYQSENLIGASSQSSGAAVYCPVILNGGVCSD